MALINFAEGGQAPIILTKRELNDFIAESSELIAIVSDLNGFKPEDLVEAITSNVFVIDSNNTFDFTP